MTAAAPDDFVTLGSVTTWLSGGTPDRSNVSYWMGTIPWISATTLKQIEVGDSDQRVTPAAVRAGSRLAPVGSTLLLVRGSALHSEIRASIVTATVCFNQDVKALVPNSRLVPRFLTYVLHANANRLLRLVTSAGNTAGVLDTNVTKRLKIWVPVLPSQERIVGVCDDVERNITLLERLIAKKQAIKQGLVQQLLTGRTRLPGFRDAWEHRRVTEMGDVLAGKALNVSGAGAMRPYLRTKNVLDGRIDLKDVLWMPMTDAEFERFHIKRGDVLLNEGQSLDLVGRCSVYNWEFGAPCAMQNQLLRFRAHAGTSPEFAAHLFRHCQRTGVFAAIATQTTSVAHLGSSRLSNLRLLWPTDPLEQAAIADVLSDTDAEIAALQARLDKTRAVRRGMMQELLTGRTRLPVAERVA
jgi:type I restriction enzyme S subunit